MKARGGWRARLVCRCETSVLWDGLTLIEQALCLYVQHAKTGRLVKSRFFYEVFHDEQRLTYKAGELELISIVDGAGKPRIRLGT